MKANGSIPVFEIVKDEVSYFETPAQASVSEPLPEQVVTGAYTIVSLSFKEDNKWRLSDGQSATISATILDKNFESRVDQGLPFAKGDVLICRIRHRQTHVPDGLRNEYDVMEVVDYKPAPRQYKLFE